MSQSTSRLLAALCGVLFIVALSSYWRLSSSSAELELEARDTGRCAQLAADIKALRELPRFAVLEATSAEMTAKRIEEAASVSRLPGRAISLIRPQSPFRLSDSPYQVRPYRIELTAVTLQQLIAFAHHLADESRGMTVRDLRIRDASRDSNRRGPELWSVELTLTQLIFSPNSRQSISSRPSVSRSERRSLHNESGSRSGIVAAANAGSRWGRGL